MENTRAALRDDAAYHAPKHFCGVHRVWLQLRWGDRAGGRVEIDVDADVDRMPRTTLSCCARENSALRPYLAFPFRTRDVPFTASSRAHFSSPGRRQSLATEMAAIVFTVALLMRAHAASNEAAFRTPGIVAMGHLGDP